MQCGFQKVHFQICNAFLGCKYGDLSLVHTGEISTSTNARHTHMQNQLSTNKAVYAHAYASHLCLCLCLCLSHQCEPGFTLIDSVLMDLFEKLLVTSNQQDHGIPGLKQDYVA